MNYEGFLKRVEKYLDDEIVIALLDEMLEYWLTTKEIEFPFQGEMYTVSVYYG